MRRQVTSTIETQDGVFEVTHHPDFSFFQHDLYLVIDSTHGRAVQTDFSESSCQKSIKDLDSHEQRCGRNTKHTYSKIISFHSR